MYGERLWFRRLFVSTLVTIGMIFTTSAYWLRF